MRQKHPKQEKTKIEYENYLIQNMGLGDSTTYVYPIFLIKMTAITQILYSICYAWARIMHQIKQLCGNMFYPFTYRNLPGWGSHHTL